MSLFARVSVRVFALIVCGMSLAHADTLKVGYFDLAPHVQQPATAANSPAVAYFDRVASKMGVTVQYDAYPLSRLLLLLEHNKLDAALILAKNKQRASLLDYPSAPFFVAQPTVAVLDKGPIRSLDQLRDQTSLNIGVWHGGYQAPSLATFKGHIVKLPGENIPSRSLDMVAMGRLDAFFSPDLYAIQFAMKQRKLKDTIRLIAIPNEAIPLYTVLSKQAGQKYKALYERCLADTIKEMPYEQFLADTLARTP